MSFQTKGYPITVFSTMEKGYQCHQLDVISMDATGKLFN
jgi:hypothetical protein